MVDVNSESYQIARRYMIRLGPEDFAQEETVEKYAKLAGLTPKEFRERFAYVIEDEQKRRT